MNDKTGSNLSHQRGRGPLARQLSWQLSRNLSGRLCVAALAVGFAVQLQQAALFAPSSYLWLLLAPMLGVLAIGVLVHSTATRFAALAATGVVLLLIATMAFAWAGLRAAWFAQSALPPEWQGLDVQVSGVIASLPRVQDGVVRFRFEPDKDGAVLSGQAVPLPLRQRLEVSWYLSGGSHWTRLASPSRAQTSNAQAPEAAAQLESVRAGDRWSFTLRLREPSGLRNPGMFDYEQWLWQAGVQASAYVRDGAKDSAPKWLGDSGQFRLDRWRQHVRDRLLADAAPHRAGETTTSASESAAAQLSQRTAGILAALVTGDQRAISQADWEIFRITGVSHLMAISGVHITMFAWLAVVCVAWLWRRSARLMLWRPASVAAAWGGLMLALAYALFSGWQLPAQRTVWMLAIWVLIATRGVRWPWHATLSLAAAVVLIIDPAGLQQAGFWLSFVAVGVLMNLAGMQASRPQPAPAPAPTEPLAHAGRSRTAGPQGGWSTLLKVPHALVRITRHFWQLQWRLTLLLIPLTVCLFGQISWSGLLANLLAIPLVTFVVTPLAMLGVWLEPALWCATWSMVYLLMALEWIAQWPYSAVYWPLVPWYWAGIGLLGGLCLVGAWPAWLRLFGALLLMLMLAWRPAPLPLGVFEVLALDIGQGAAMLVRTRHHAMLFDAGPSLRSGGDAGERVVLPVLQGMGVVPELLVLSHNDSDHTGGAHALIQAFPAMHILAPFPQQLLRAYTGITSQPLALHSTGHTGGMSQCHQGLRWSWDGVEFGFLYPTHSQLERWFDPSGWPTPLAPSTNATSCVLMVRAAQGGSAMFTGDIGRLQELELWQLQAELIKADWLQMPHHGSRSSSSPAFIQAVAPRFAIAQTGYRNSYGHPHADVVARYVAAGVQVIDSPHCGASRWRSSAPADIECEREIRQRYWQRPSGP